MRLGTATSERRPEGWRGSWSALLLLLLLLLLPVSPTPAQEVDPAALSSLAPRSIGPAGTGGEVTAVAVDPVDPRRVFVGTAGGGVWRSRNAGTTWVPVLDGITVRSVGALAVSPADPEVVWVGAGSATGTGTGVFRSRDGGSTWEPLGPEGVAHVGRIVLHPTDPDVAWIAAAGRDRVPESGGGVFGTTDGGGSWRGVLQPGSGLDALDLAVDTDDPDRLYAAVGRKEADASRDGGTGDAGGLYASVDGGESWEPVEEGVPVGSGALAVAVAPSDPRIVYALVRSPSGIRLVRSGDGGGSWSTRTRIRGDASTGGRGAIRVDSSDSDLVYRLGGTLTISRDGGASFDRPGSSLRGVVRALSIDPSDPARLLAGTDRGLFTSRDGGDSWRFLDGLSLASVRGVSLDLARPYRVYAAMERAGTWRGPSTSWRQHGLRSALWTRLEDGDGRTVLADPRDSRFVFSATRDGRITRHDRATDERKGARPWAPRDADLRFGETVPLAVDPFRPELLYAGSQFVHRSPDRGETWQIISGDLTRGSGPSASISSIGASPVEEELLWVGTEDGRLHLTRSSGGNWTEVTDALPGDAPGRIRAVTASRHHGGTAFVSVDRSGGRDRTGGLFRTGNHGESWERLAGAGELGGAVHAVEQDPVAPQLLFAGTSRGLFVSLTAGRRWFRWPAGPPAGVRALGVHPGDYDLVIGTAGRGIWILDDVRPLRELARRPGLLGRSLHLFEPPPAYLHHRGGPRGHAGADDHRFRGDDRPYGALLTYSVGPEIAADSLRMEVYDEGGRVVRTLVVPGAAGVHRVAWDLGVEHEAGEVVRDGEGVPLIRALPGRYTVTLQAPGGPEVQRPFRVLPDPRSDLAPGERERGQEAALRAVGLLRVSSGARERLERAEDALGEVLAEIRNRSGDGADALRERTRALVERGRELREGATTVRSEVRGLADALSGSFGPPTEAQRITLQELEEETSGLAERVNRFLLGRISLFQDRLREEDVGVELPEFEAVEGPGT